MAKHSTTPNLTTGGWLRMALYAVAVLVGLAAVLAEPLGFGGLTGVLTSLSGLLLAVTGGTAALNIGKADDQQLSIRDIIPSIGALLAEVRELRSQSATPQDVADEIEARQWPNVPRAEKVLDQAREDQARESQDAVFSVYH